MTNTDHHPYSLEARTPAELAQLLEQAWRENALLRDEKADLEAKLVVKRHTCECSIDEVCHFVRARDAAEARAAEIQAAYVELWRDALRLEAARLQTEVERDAAQAIVEKARAYVEAKNAHEALLGQHAATGVDALPSWQTPAAHEARAASREAVGVAFDALVTALKEGGV